jgi:enoyl-CoA hydratase/carnithine racemase
MFELTLNGPGKNALSTTMLNTILEKLREAGGKPILLTGAGDAFCAGLDLKEIATLDDRGMMAFLELLEETMARLFTYPGPTVACINGHAVAGGCVLALACDYRVVVPDARARIGLNEVAIGLRFPPRTFSIVRRRIPIAYREQVLLGAELHNPVNALRLGLVDEIAEDAATVARDRLAVFAKHPAGAYAATKSDLRGSLDRNPEEERYFREAVLPVWTSEPIRARIAAVLKR